jgi:hypothetical protein
MLRRLFSIFDYNLKHGPFSEIVAAISEAEIELRRAYGRYLQILSTALENDVAGGLGYGSLGCAGGRGFRACALLLSCR